MRCHLAPIKLANKNRQECEETNLETVLMDLQINHLRKPFGDTWGKDEKYNSICRYINNIEKLHTQIDTLRLFTTSLYWQKQI